MTRDANGVSEVKYKNFVEQCVGHPEEKGRCRVLGIAGELFSHEDLWDRWALQRLLYTVDATGIMSSGVTHGEVLRTGEQDHRPNINSGANVWTGPLKFRDHHPIELPRANLRTGSRCGVIY